MIRIIFLLLISSLLFTSCAVTVERHGLIRGSGIEVTCEEEDGEETELFRLQQRSGFFGDSFYLSMPFITVDAYKDHWRGRNYVDIDIFR